VPTLIGLTLTDNDGRYTLEMIEPGTYYVMAGQIDAPSYYPGVSALSSAKSILVTAGARITGLDFKTAVPLMYVVSGRVMLQPGQKLAPGSRMTLAGAEAGTVRPDGMFEITGVRPGNYSLRLAPDAFLFAMPVVVEDRNVTGIEFPNAAMVSVNGSVVMEDASSAPNISVSFVDIRQNRILDVATRRSFAFFAPEGELRAAAKRVPNGYQVKSFTAGSVDLLRNSLKLSVTEPVVALTMTLKTVPTVAFGGRAVSSRGVLQPLRSIRMESAEKLEPLQGAVQPDSSFAFDRIAPGDYTATLVTGSDELRMYVTVPPEGRLDAEIVIPELRHASVRLGIEANVPEGARPVITLQFETAGAMKKLAIDGSSGETPLKLSLREGQYRVTATIREAAGTGTTRVKKLSSGTIDLLTFPLDVGENLEEIQVTIGR
jgi:hypothetical protein